MRIYTYVTEAQEVRDMVWSGAKATVEHLTDEEIEQILSALEDCDIAMTATQLNDFFWFDETTWLEWINVTLEEWDARW